MKGHFTHLKWACSLLEPGSTFRIKTMSTWEDCRDIGASCDLNVRLAAHVCNGYLHQSDHILDGQHLQETNIYLAFRIGFSQRPFQ